MAKDVSKNSSLALKHKDDLSHFTVLHGFCKALQFSECGKMSWLQFQQNYRKEILKGTLMGCPMSELLLQDALRKRSGLGVRKKSVCSKWVL